MASYLTWATAPRLISLRDMEAGSHEPEARIAPGYAFSNRLVASSVAFNESESVRECFLSSLDRSGRMEEHPSHGDQQNGYNTANGEADQIFPVGV